MITILKKIRHKLINENKLRNYLFYGIGEVFLVVIGILIAVQINNWNNLKNSKNEAISQIESLENEISINIKRNEAYIKSYNKSLEETNSYIMLFSEGSNRISDESIIRMYSTMAPINGRVLTKTAYKDINKSNVLNTIYNDSLRKMILGYGLLIEADKKSNSEFSEGWNKYLFPYFLKNANLIFTEDTDPNNLSKTTKSINTDAFVDNTEFLNLLILRKGYTSHFIALFKYQNEFFKKLLKKINSFLTKMSNND